MNAKLKKLIFNKLYKDLSGVEIIPHKKSVWFIDRDKKYWYLRYEKNGELWWRYNFFTEFFRLFSMEELEFQWVISEWVEEVLNYKVKTPLLDEYIPIIAVEEVLNFKVKTPYEDYQINNTWVEEVLNCKVESPIMDPRFFNRKVEEILNCKVETPKKYFSHSLLRVEEVLNCKVKTLLASVLKAAGWVEEVLEQTKS